MHRSPRKIQQHKNFIRKYVQLSQWNIYKKIAILFLGGLFFIWAIGLFIIYTLYLHNLPSIETIETRDLSESTIFYDREGKELYKLYKNEKRTYVPYIDIAEDIKNAIVSTEDKSFFTNPWVDILGIIRAWVNFAIGKTAQIKGTSTISQQLIRNSIISNERSFSRKIKEIYLSYRLNSRYSKEKILELYLNTISFGNNAYGIEEAAHTYFWKWAKDVWLLWATILTSLPKGPTFYSPYAHRDRLMGYAYVYQSDSPDEKITLDSVESRKKYEQLYKTFKNYLSGLTFEDEWWNIRICHVQESYMKPGRFSIWDDECITTSKESSSMMSFLNGIVISGKNPSQSWSHDYKLEYEAGRKDLVASNLLEDGKINWEDLHKVVYDGLEFEFKRYAENIRYPYFVFYVKEYLEETYGKDLDIMNGLRVYTTIDPKLQDKAEELVKKQTEINKKNYGAWSAALVSMDNKTGEILAMVGWPDYFDEENWGNNNMITAKRQPGSSFKPIVYALAISKNPIGPETPIYDVDTKFWKWEPENYDQQFEGKMMVKTALDHSRNIPAIKMYYLAWEEKEIVNFGNSIGINSLKQNMDYWAPLSIGTAELKPIELMQWYSVFANQWKLQPITSILKIEDSDGNILEEHNNIQKPKQVFSAWASYILSKILSDNESRPAWGKRLELKGRFSAAKTGTSNKDVSTGKEKKILPRDLWTAWYTPQITTVVWAGNVDGRETKGNCDGINCAWPIWHDFMDFAHIKLPKEEFIKPDWIQEVYISRLSGKRAPENLPDSLKIKTIIATDLEKLEFDTPPKSLQIDTLCNWSVGPNTPEEAIWNIFIQTSYPVIDGYKKDWVKSIPGFWNLWYIEGWEGTGSTVEYKTDICERPTGPGDVIIKLRVIGWGTGTTTGRRLIEVSYTWNRPIQTLRIRQWDMLKFETLYASGMKEIGVQRAAINIDESSNILTAEIIDSFWFKYTQSETLTVINNQSAPKIIMINPKEWDQVISIYEKSFFNLRFSTTIATATKEVSVLIDWINYKNYTEWDVFTLPINSDGTIQPWSHKITIRVTDELFRQAEKTVLFTVLKR